MSKTSICLFVVAVIVLCDGKLKKALTPPHCTQVTKDTDYVSYFKLDYPVAYIVPGQHEAYQKVEVNRCARFNERTISDGYKGLAVATTSHGMASAIKNVPSFPPMDDVRIDFTITPGDGPEVLLPIAMYCLNPPTVNKAVAVVCDWAAPPQVQFTLGDDFMHVVRQDPTGRFLGNAVINTYQLCGHNISHVERDHDVFITVN